jgi:hypothetical protein
MPSDGLWTRSIGVTTRGKDLEHDAGIPLSPEPVDLALFRERAEVCVRVPRWPLTGGRWRPRPKSPRRRLRAHREARTSGRG